MHFIKIRLSYKLTSRWQIHLWVRYTSFREFFLLNSYTYIVLSLCWDFGRLLRLTPWVNGRPGVGAYANEGMISGHLKNIKRNLFDNKISLTAQLKNYFLHWTSSGGDFSLECLCGGETSIIKRCLYQELLGHSYCMCRTLFTFVTVSISLYLFNLHLLLWTLWIDQTFLSVLQTLISY